MLKKHTLIATGFIGWFVLSVSAQTAEINVALKTWGSRAIASSSYAEPGNDNYGPDNALDGRFAARETDKWNSAKGQQAPFWLTIDFGRERVIHKIVVRHDDGAVTSDFQLQWGDGKIEWKDIVSPIVSNKEAVSTHIFNPLKMRCLRLFITKGEPNANAYARIFEVEAYAQADTLGADEQNRGDLFTAFALERAINSGKWTEEQFKQATELLKHDDLFVRALADFAVSEAVGQKNNGQTVAWTAEQLKNEPWFATWSTTSHEQKIIYDYIRHLFLQHKAVNIEAMVSDIAECMGRGVLMEKGGLDKDERFVRYCNEIVSLHDKMSQASFEDCQKMWVQARNLWRQAVLLQKGVDFENVVLYTRYGFHHKPNVCGMMTAWSHKPGGDILSVSIKDGKATPVTEGKLGAGHFQGMDLWYDADKIIFSFATQPVWPVFPDNKYPTKWPEAGSRNDNYAYEYRETMEPLHLYEIDLKTKKATQLTDHNYWSDTEPVYLPSGEIVFSSDRFGHSPSCDSVNNDLSDQNLFTLTADRKIVRRLANHKDIDMTPRVLPNGLIAYLRWEYQERNFMDIHSVWTIKPDGAMADALFKQHLFQPHGVRQATGIGDGTRMIALATGHHSLPQGPLVLLNPATGINSPEGVEVLTQGMRVNEGGVPGKPPAEGGRKEVPGFYTDPIALSPTCYMASYAFLSPPARHYRHEAGDVDSNGYGVYLVDIYGNKELLYRDAFMGAYAAQPLRPRKKQPILAKTTDRTKNYATCVIPDVYKGIEGEKIRRGTIKYIRISEALPWPLLPREGVKRWVSGWTNQDKGAARWCPVRVIGIVPVEADGSAYFKVPISDNASVYFQALDSDFMEVRRMRSSVSFAPGEQRSCNGCHETRNNTEVKNSGVALMGKPAEPVPPAWGATKPIDFDRDIQPIFTKNCVSCHGGEKPKAELDFSAGKAFRTVRDKKLVVLSNAFGGNGAISEPYQFGSPVSRLTKAIRNETHQKRVKLTQEEWLPMVTGVDANIPYTGKMFHKRMLDGRKNVWAEFDWTDPWAYPTEEPAMGVRVPKGMIQ